MSRFLLKLPIYFYRLFISPWLRPRCRFLPTCSEYALDAITLYGPYKGCILALRRICRCHPWGGDGFDPANKLETVEEKWKNTKI